jgi:hypothetical protein
MLVSSPANGNCQIKFGGSIENHFVDMHEMVRDAVVKKFFTTTLEEQYEKGIDGSAACSV